MAMCDGREIGGSFRALEGAEGGFPAMVKGSAILGGGFIVSVSLSIDVWVVACVSVSTPSLGSGFAGLGSSSMGVSAPRVLNVERLACR